MEDPTLAYEDMLFFERRLTEVISGMQPKVRKWKALLLLTILFTAYTAYYWVSDPSLKVISLWDSLMLHPTFTASLSVLIILFIFFGVHNRVVAPKIIATRCRTVLADFCLSCDDHGKLIVRPAYSPAVSPTTLTPQKQVKVSPICTSTPIPQPSFGCSSAGFEEDAVLMNQPDNRNLLRTF